MRTTLLPLAVAGVLATSLACVQGDSSPEIRVDVPAGGEVTVVVTSEATPNAADFSDSFRLDFQVSPENFVPLVSGIDVALEGSLTGNATTLFADSQGFSGFLIANDVLSGCAVGERCSVETTATFRSVNAASSTVAVYGTITIDGGDVTVHRATIAAP